MVYKVKLDIKPNITMAEWCNKNCSGDWFGTDNLNESWIFELEIDALAFKLRWM